VIDAGIIAGIVGLLSALTAWASRSRTISNDEWRLFVDELQADRDYWRTLAMELRDRLEADGDDEAEG